jgi:hypothetical protein
VSDQTIVNKLEIQRGRSGWMVFTVHEDGRGCVYSYSHGVSTLAEAIELVRQLLSFHPAEPAKDTRK